MTLNVKRESVLYGTMAALIATVFIADLMVPLGTAVWVVYALPVALGYFALRPPAPLILAALVTILVVVGFTLADLGIDPEVAQINRIMGVVTIWILAGTGYLFIQSKLAVQRQDWLQKGQVGLTEYIAGEQRTDELGENLLKYLTDYLGAQVGALFIQSDVGFRRYATVGVPADARVPSQVSAGDGLIGQAIAERRAKIVDDVPDNYLYFGSSMGQTKPRHLVIAPMATDGQVNAVVELGFAARRADTQVLLEQISDTVAVAIRSAKYRARLQELLEETQQQAEELQAQASQLRQSNEELEEHTQALQDSQTRLELQQSELEQTNAQLEEQTQVLESQRNDLARAQSALQAQAQDLEQASRYKSEFLANMSHELRTPLNSLLIMARLLIDNRGGNLTDEQVKFAQTIETSGNDLLSLINDILDISKIEAGRADLSFDRIQLPRLVGKLQSTFSALASEKGLKFRTEISADLPSDIESDPQRLEQILKNFLSNAIKFTERGEVVLSVARARDGYVGFSVKDTGIGVPAEQQQVIFEAFRQADGTINRKYGGTGLGLSISRELSRLLAGEIVVESAVGQGSTFTLVLPETFNPALVQARGRADGGRLIQTAPVPAPAARLPVSEPDARPIVVATRNPIQDDRERLTGDSRVILVVEDDMAFAKILFDLAHELGFMCLVADTADEGVILARQYLPHAVILDIGLPDHTGLSVLDRLKRDARTRHIPVHVASVEDYSQAAMSFGAVGYMMKPVTRNKLVQALEGFETKLAQRVRRVLIVEDDATQLDSVQSLLATRDVETVGVRTGEDCLAQLRAETFDCMVLDLTLPDMSGFDLLTRLSQDEAFAFPPVIVYTGRELSADDELKLRKFSKSIIIKGARSPERLLDEVTLFLHQVVSELPEKQQRMLARSLNKDATLEGRRILVVEDDIRNVYALTSILEPHGAVVEIARNGREALEKLDLTAVDGVPAIDMVLMDVMMPEMDGLTATKEIRRRPAFAALPIITLTAKAMLHDQEECLAAGANDYLAKPLDVDKLLSLVRVWMPR